MNILEPGQIGMEWLLPCSRASIVANGMHLDLWAGSLPANLSRLVSPGKCEEKLQQIQGLAKKFGWNFGGGGSKLPSGKLSHSYGKIHHFEWVNPLFLWPFTIAMLVYQRV